MQPFDTRELRNAFGSFMTGVTVVTTRTAEAVPLGLTVNSFSSVSLEPPLLLFSLENNLSSLPVFIQQQRFAVNILAETQRIVSNTFAIGKGDRFADLDWEWSAGGNPLLGGVAAWFDCSLHQAIPAGDHTVLIGRVEAFQDNARNGLGYSRHGYFDLGLERAASELRVGGAPVTLGAIVEHAGAILLLKNAGGGLSLPNISDDAMRGLKDLLKASGVSGSFGTIYSIYEDETSGEHFIYYHVNALSAYTPVNGVYYPLDALPLERLPTPAIRNMLQRYAQEYKSSQFGLYYGTDKQGRVRLLDNTASGETK